MNRCNIHNQDIKEGNHCGECFERLLLESRENEAKAKVYDIAMQEMLLDIEKSIKFMEGDSHDLALALLVQRAARMRKRGGE
jgi:hypothetical protein